MAFNSGNHSEVLRDVLVLTISFLLALHATSTVSIIMSFRNFILYFLNKIQ